MQLIKCDICGKTENPTSEEFLLQMQMGIALMYHINGYDICASCYNPYMERRKIAVKEIITDMKKNHDSGVVELKH